jgi:hypothetical protein
MLLTILSQQGAVAGVTADLSATLDAATLSADATVTSTGVTADLSATLDAATLSADATLVAPITADLSATLDAATLTADVTLAVPITADLSATLGALTLASYADAGGAAAPARRPKRHSGKRPFVLQMPGGAGTVATADDRDLLEIVNILASTGVFHGQDRTWQ